MHSPAQTVIHSNGSKWAGDEQDSIETLLEVLAGPYVLDRIFECDDDHAFIDRDDETGMVRFFGNFLELSHVFSIDTDEPATIAKLTAAIDANMERPDYRSQATFRQREVTKAAHFKAEQDKRQAERVRQAKSVLGMAS